MARRLSIAAKFFLTHLVIAGIALLIAGAVGFFLVRSLVMADADENLLARARIVAETFRPLLADPAQDKERIPREGDRLGKEIGGRITVVLPDGAVVADSAVGAAGVAGMENHALHPEIRDALSGTTGVSHRRSISVREEQRYAAIPIAIGGAIVGVARASVPVATLTRRLWQLTAIIWGTGFAALLLILGGTALMARKVTGPLAEMQAAAKEMGGGNLARRAQVRSGDELEEMANAMNRMASRLADTIEQLDAEKTRLETLLANLDDGIVVVAADRTVRMMNREAGKIFDASETMGAGRPYPEVIRHPQALAFIDGWTKGEGPNPRDVSIATRQGIRTVRCSGTTVRYLGESNADVLLTLQDVTEERRLSQIKSDFVSNASHELRTPLTNIRGYLEAIQDAVREDIPPAPSFVAVAHANALRMERLIDDLLELSRAESAGVPLEKEEVPLRTFLSRIAEFHRLPAERAGKTVEVVAGEGTLRADVRKLSLAVSNLVDNAVKYGKEGGQVTVSGKIEPSGCTLEVKDDGPGIPPEDIPRIFERFYRVDKGRSREMGGTGLGLSIARHVVESHGGTIRAESRLGVGTRFTIRIPG
ncbi:MAG: multi-sensor signal transduction histidine kinase [Deltaproteobacteria bacterium]|nr:multi-sensor signal transduction histidine kinase [Deltaproteobacteria bacterium]MBP2687070.1 multi-sensor signal transduction histidine kinase [Deltaproteobacteria bacterium]